MRILPHASPLVGLPGSVIPAFSPTFPTVSKRPPQNGILDKTHEQSINPTPLLAEAGANRSQRTGWRRKPWYLQSNILNLLTVASVGDTVAAIAVFCVGSRHNTNTAGYVVWLTVAVGITSVLLSFVVCLKISRRGATQFDIQDIDLECTLPAHQKEAMIKSHTCLCTIPNDEDGPKNSRENCTQEQQRIIERKPVANSFDHFYFEHPDFEFAEWHRSNQSSPASQSGPFARSGLSRSFSPYKVQQSRATPQKPEEYSPQRPESKLLPPEPLVIRPSKARLGPERRYSSPLYSYPTSNVRGPSPAEDTLRKIKETPNKLQKRQSIKALASPPKDADKVVTASDLSSLVRHMARATELNAYRNRPSGSKPDIRQGVQHTAHVATFHCASPELESTIRQVEPSSPTTTKSVSSTSLPLRTEEPINNDDGMIQSAEKGSENQRKHNLTRAASWETVQTTATSLYRAPSSPSNPHFNNSIPSIPTLARDYTLSDRPEKINTHLRPPIPGSYPLSSPARPNSDKKNPTTIAPNSQIKTPTQEVGNKSPAQAVRKTSIKRLQSATSARLRKTVRKIDIYHDPVGTSTSTTTPATQSEAVGLGLGINLQSGTSHSRTNSLSPRSNAAIPRSPAEKENLSDYAGAYAGSAELIFSDHLRRDDDGRYTPEIWEDEGMVVGEGFEGVEVYEGT